MSNSFNNTGERCWCGDWCSSHPLGAKGTEAGQMRWSNKCNQALVISWCCRWPRWSAETADRVSQRTMNLSMKITVFPLCRCQYPWCGAARTSNTIALTNAHSSLYRSSGLAKDSHKQLPKMKVSCHSAPLISVCLDQPPSCSRSDKDQLMSIDELV